MSQFRMFGCLDGKRRSGAFVPRGEKSSRPSAGWIPQDDWSASVWRSLWWNESQIGRFAHVPQWYWRCHSQCFRSHSADGPRRWTGCSSFSSGRSSFIFFFFFPFFFSADDYFLLFFSTEVIVVNIMPDFESRYTLDCNDMSKVKKWNYVWIDWMFYAGIRINETMNDFGYMWRVVQVVRDYETRKARIKELSNAINRISDRASLIEQKMYLSTTFADIIWLFWLITEPV